MDELNLDELEKDINNKTAVEDKFKDVLKHKKAAEDKAEVEAKARAEAESKLAALEKKTTFLNSFSEAVAKNPQAAEYRDKIEQKFGSGYSLEDAMISTLVSEGKYIPPAPPRENIAGGSAANQIVTNGAPKSASEMTKDEKLNALAEAEKRGDLGLA